MQTIAVSNMLRSSKLRVEKIAEYADVTVAFVREVQQKLASK